MKIALCFSGQARSYQAGYEYYKKNLLDDYEVDVYIHTWDNPDFGKQLFDDLNILYRPKNIVIQSPIAEPWIDIKYPNTPNPEKYPSRFSYSMFYSMNAVSNMIQEEYDWVIKSRTDYALNVKIPFETLDNSKLYIPNCRMVPTKDFGNDQFAFSSQENMMKYMTTFDNIDEYYSNGVMMNGEAMMQANLHKHNLHGDKLEYVNMNNPFSPGKHNGTWHSLIREDYEAWTK